MAAEHHCWQLHLFSRCKSHPRIKEGAAAGAQACRHVRLCSISRHTMPRWQPSPAQRRRPGSLCLCGTAACGHVMQAAPAMP